MVICFANIANNIIIINVFVNGVVLVFTVNAIFVVIIVITFIFSNFIIITSYDKYGIVYLSVY